MPGVKTVKLRGYVLARFDGEELYVGDVTSIEAAHAELSRLPAVNQIEAVVMPVTVELETEPIVAKLLEDFELKLELLSKINERIIRESN